MASPNLSDNGESFGRGVSAYGNDGNQVVVGGIDIPEGGFVRTSEGLTILNPTGTMGSNFGLSVLGTLATPSSATRLVVGAPGGTQLSGSSVAGFVYVYDENGDLLYQVSGPTGKRLGMSLCSVGDRNGDGYEDFLAGAPGDWLASSNSCARENVSGEAWLISGFSGQVLGIYSSAGANFFGFACALVGDLDGDGFRDWGIAAPYGGPNGGFIIFWSGKTGNFLLSLFSPDPSSEGFGYAFTAGFDFDRDGVQDLAVGSPLNNRVYLYSGQGLSSGAQPIHQLEGPDSSWFGAALAGLRDFDGDGFGDLAVGAPRTNPDTKSPSCPGSAEPSGFVNIISGRDWSSLGIVSSSNSGSGLGISLATVDYDGDGFSEVIVGGRRMNAQPNPTVNAVPIISRQRGGVPIFGPPGEESLFGLRVANLGDLDGDGVNDFGVADPSFSHSFCTIYSGFSLAVIQTHEGARSIETIEDIDQDGVPDYVLGYPADINIPGDTGETRFLSGATHELMGMVPVAGLAFATGEDVTGDGLPDVLIGTARTTYSLGKVALVESQTWEILYESALEESGLGFDVAFVDDQDGDGTPDFLVGAPTGVSDWPGTGYAEIRSAPHGGLLWRHDNASNRRLGTATVSLGDIDGDGIGDYACSTWDTVDLCQGGSCSGTIIAYKGGVHTQLWSSTSSNPYDGPTHGYFLLSVQDQNGDGIRDLIVGNPGRGTSTTRGLGRVRLLDGADGSDLETLQGFDGGYGGWDYFGYSGADMGDLDGDGQPDYVVGAPTENNPGQSNGTPTRSRVVVVLSGSVPSDNFCLVGPSTNGPALIGALGSTSLSANNLYLQATGLPTQTPVAFFVGLEQPPIPFGAGYLCISPPSAVRLIPIQQSSATGVASFPVDLSSPDLSAIMPGTSWAFQCWFRDPASGLGFGLSDALRIQFEN